MTSSVISQCEQPHFRSRKPFLNDKILELEYFSYEPKFISSVCSPIVLQGKIIVAFSTVQTVYTPIQG